MRLMLLLALFIHFSSCRKELPMTDISGFEGKYLTCDSIRTIARGNERLIVMGKGTGLDATFDSVYTIYSDPPQQYLYSIKYAKIYYWPANVDMHEGDYLTIIHKSEKQLHLEYKQAGTSNRTIYYYSAE